MPPKHDRKVRELAVELFDEGHGRDFVAARLCMSSSIVEKWHLTYRSVGSEALLGMGSRKTRYDWETKVAAARAVVEEGMSRPEAMAAFGIASRTPLDSWCRLYREGGADALRPKPKGRPKGSEGEGAPKTREQELEARVRRLEAENAYLKKSPRPGGGKVSSWEKSQVIEMLSGQGHALSDLLAVAGLPRSTYYRARSHPPRPTRPELRGKVAEVFSRTANGCGHRQIAMALRAEEGAVVAGKTVLRIMREMGIRCGIRRESDYHRYNSFKGLVGRTFENVLDRDFSADGPWQKIGTDVTEFRAPWGKAYFAPAYDFGSKEIVSWSISRSPNMAQQKEMLEGLLAKKPGAANPIMHSDMGWQYQHDGYCRVLEKAGIVQSMSRKGNCIDNGATEQIFGHIKDEFFRGRGFESFAEFKERLKEYIVHWNTRRRQVKLKGLTPEEFRNQSLVA